MGKYIKYVVSIILIGVLLSLFLIYNVMKVQKSNNNIFYDSGYILKNASSVGETQNVERYYFNANQPYKNTYNERVVFNNTNGEEIITEKNNFVHYTNGSVSALEKGVILNLEEIDSDPIVYYNIAENKVLKKAGTTYTIQHLDKELKFTNFIWKISNQKYLLIGNPIKIVFDEGNVKTIEGYVEIEYMDNEIIKIYNQEATYQTISSNAYIALPSNVKIRLANKIVSKDNQNRMSLDNMVIDAEDNVEIVDLDEYKEENNTENQTANDVTNEVVNEVENQDQNNTTNNNQQQTNGITNTNTNTVTNENTNIENNMQVNGNTTTENSTGDSIDNISQSNNIDINDSGANTETEVTDENTIIEPKFKIENFEVSSISLNSVISVEDEDNLLTGDVDIKIVQNNNSKIIYQSEETSGSTSIEVSVATLLPNTDYTLSLEASYQVDGITYTKNFIYKIFRTEFVGVDFEKDYFTNNKMNFKIEFDKDTKIQGADMVILNNQNEIVETRKITPETGTVEFDFLNSNSEYTVKLINILYDDQIITNGFEISKKYKTLKNKPTVSGTYFEIDKRNATFTLKLSNLIDTDNGITSLRYEIYDTRKDLTSNQIPEHQIQTTKSQETVVPVDNIKIHRGVPYTFKVIATFNDNEKTIEYESEYSDVMLMEGVDFPTVRFEKREVTFERIQGNLVIEDNSNTISLDSTNKFIVTYTDSVGVSNTFTSQGSLVIPIDINNLRSNETYKFSIYTRVDLQDNNDPIDECYIGGAVIKTEKPNNLMANFLSLDENLSTPFNIRFKLSDEKELEGDSLEAQTLSGMTFSIYAGQDCSGTAIKTVKVVDKNLEPYESNLKEEYYDKTVTITPEFFGAKNSDFKEKYYTVAVTSAYDYTRYPNQLPIVKNTFTVETNGYVPDLPTDLNNAIDVTVLRNRDKDQRADLNSDTITGYTIKASYDNSQLLAKRIIYKVYNDITNTVIKTVEMNIGSDGVIPEYTFNVLDGTSIQTQDNDELRRGSPYYFTYEMELDLNKDGTADTKYPYQTGGEEIVLRSVQVLPVKQEATFLTYPSISTSNKLKYKYNFKDIDHTLENDKMIASIGGSIRDRQPIEATGEGEFKTIEFVNLIPGNLSLSVTRRLDKTQLSTQRQLANYYFEGEKSVKNVSYTTSLDSNRVIITLLDQEQEVENIAAVTVEFVTDDLTIRKEFLTPENNIIAIGLNELEGLLNKRITVNVYAYYDTGIIGYDLDSQYYTYQKAYIDGEQKYYYTLSQRGDFVETTTVKDNIYLATRNGLLLNVIQASGNGETGRIALQYGQSGMKYGYDVILQKQIKKQLLTTNGMNMIEFDKIIPGITLKGANNELNISSELDRVSFRAQIIKADGIEIKDDTIYVDVYKTDENGITEELSKTVTVNLNDFTNQIEITGLEAKTYYFLKFRTIIVKENGTQEEVDLYDIDYQVVGKHYYFSTLANVGISNVEITYNPVSYEEKTIDVQYNLDKILGYQKIIYNIYKYNETTGQYDILIPELEDTFFKKQMIKKIDASPGSEFEFGKKYKIEIIPIAVYTDQQGITKEIELGTVNKVFELPELSKPIIGVKSARENDNSLSFKITIYDSDRIVQNDKYKIKVLNYMQEDITPNEYKDKEFSTDDINNTIQIVDADKYEEYSIEIVTNLDYDNDKTDLVEFKKTHIAPALSEKGIAVGNITVSVNQADQQKLDLIFNNSYKLTEIDQIRYSIYNINGYATNNTVGFIPTEIREGDDVFYTFTLDEAVTTTGNYYIELQFLKEGEILDVASIEYTYIE